MKVTPAKNREYHLKSRYGISIEEYEELLKQNNGCCWICGRKSKKRRLAVDHKHDKSKKVRGLLCYKCNYGLTWFNDNPELLKSAAKYLEKYN